MNKKTYTYEEALEASTEYFGGDDMAASNFVGKYALSDDDGNYYEKTPEDMHHRIAKEFARIEEKYPNPLSEQNIFRYLDHFKYIIPQGSPMSGIGNPFKVMSLGNCFVIRSPYDSYGGIMKSDQELAQLMKRRAGVGLDISNIRPKGVPTKNAAKTTDGIGVFMERFSNTCREVAQSGRRGAEMQTISVHHPEILTFVKIKRDKTKVTGANVSLRLSDEFMEAVRDNKEYEQRWPVDSESPVISNMVNARDVWKEIIYSAWFRAEPGLLFWDNVTKNSPADCYATVNEDFRTICTNPSLHPDTKVLTKDGVFRIEDLCDKKFYVKNIYNQYKEAICFQSGISKNVLEIEFTNGQKVICTPEHKWPVLSTLNKLTDGRSGKINKKSSSDLKRKDKIPLINTGINNSSCTFNRDDGFILGWNLGDGWISWHKNNKSKQFGFIFSKDDVDSGISKFCLNKTNNLAKRPSSLMQDHGTQSWSYVTTDSNVVAYFDSMKARNKIEGIPESVWVGNNDFIMGFVDGLFSSDGHIHVEDKLSKCYINLTTSHEAIANDVRSLLCFYGIKSNIVKSSKNDFNRFDLRVFGMHAKKFFGSFKLTNIKKQRSLEEINKKDSSMYKNDRNYLSVKTIKEYGTSDVFDIKVLDSTNTFATEVGITGNCGEIPMGPDSCRLMVVNLYTFVKDKFKESSNFDYASFVETVMVAQRLMDDLIDLELECIDKIIAKIESDPEPEEVKAIELNLWKRFRNNCYNGRRTGLGITGLGDALAAMGIRYGSPESIEVTEEIYRQLAVGAYKSSCILAGERGAFPLFDASLEEGHEFIQRILSQDTELRELYNTNGRRNIALTTTAPTGTVSTQTQTTSGIEPAFLLHYDRFKKVNPGDKNVVVDRVDAVGDSWQKFTVYHHAFKEWMQVTGKTEVDQSPYYKATSNDVDWISSVDIQAVAQKWICHAISKTCNIPKDASEDLVADIYMRAWEKGCKGFTVYRDECRDGVLVSSEEENKSTRSSPKRPKTLRSETSKIKLDTGDGIKNSYVTVSYFPKTKKPYEVFINTPVGNNIKDLQILELSARMTSLALRHGVDVRFVIDQLTKIDGQYIFSIPNSLAKSLSRYIEDDTDIEESNELLETIAEEDDSKKKGTKCSNCGNYSYIMKEGCGSCLDCGHSNCS